MINGKAYIGQTKDFKRRLLEHKNRYLKEDGEEKDKVLYRAMRKYGANNFKIELIDYCEDYNEEEMFYISYYDTYRNGYNMTEGGENPPILAGIDSPFLTHDPEDQKKVKYLLANTNLSPKEIGEITGYNTATVNRINIGKLWRDDQLTYPIRKLKKHLSEEVAHKIKDDLRNTNLTHRQIGERHGVAKSTVTMINIGKNYFDNNENYPIRK